ncbi:NifB/NifX family molybdenum-iron cluster-binding protein [bacterium]|nr:NifB/NifX family molybdenum-iron cluster-binding protein [bacterium]
MKIAISTDGDFVSSHFGRCPHFTIVDIDNNEVVKKEIIDNPGHHPGFIPQFLHQKGVECIVAGGMGAHAIQLFNETKIKTIVGISGTIKETIEKLGKGTLASKESLCSPGAGKDYGVEKTVCDHSSEE